jgi:hypothetical protein
VPQCGQVMVDCKIVMDVQVLGAEG